MAEIRANIRRLKSDLAELEHFVERVDARLKFEDLTRDEIRAQNEQLHSALEEVRTLYETVCAQSDELAAALSTAHAERERYRHLFEHAPHAYIVTDAHGVIREANSLACAIFGTPRELLAGTPLASLVEQAARPMFRRDLIHLTDMERMDEWEVTMRPPKSPPFKAALSVSVVPDQTGRVNVLRWLVRDITERVQVATLWTVKRDRRRATCTVVKSAAGLELVVAIDDEPPRRELFQSWPEVLQRSAELREGLKNEAWR